MAEWIVEVKDGKFPIGKWTELVRCKDCRHNPDGYENGSVPKTRCPLWCGWCFNIDAPDPDFFCAYGEKLKPEYHIENDGTYE